MDTSTPLWLRQYQQPFFKQSNVMCLSGHLHQNNLPSVGLVLVRLNAESKLEILLDLRSSLVSHPNTFSFISGTVNFPTEDLLETAYREAREEYGITPCQLNPFGLQYTRDHGGAKYLTYTYIFAEYNPKDGLAPASQSSECVRSEWFTLDTLPPNIIPYIAEDRVFLDQILLDMVLPILLERRENMAQTPQQQPQQQPQDSQPPLQLCLGQPVQTPSPSNGKSTSEFKLQPAPKPSSIKTCIKSESDWSDETIVIPPLSYLDKPDIVPACDDKRIDLKVNFVKPVLMNPPHDIFPLSTFKQIDDKLQNPERVSMVPLKELSLSLPPKTKTSTTQCSRIRQRGKTAGTPLKQVIEPSARIRKRRAAPKRITSGAYIRKRSVQRAANAMTQSRTSAPRTASHEANQSFNHSSFPNLLSCIPLSRYTS
ncbi:hypothetical protein GGS21DRAFT_197849 [Xylaria nigripes]|nr:hypothetical protein GGS21DRAFT_197849 [Xylaria nigripes]